MRAWKDMTAEERRVLRVCYVIRKKTSKPGRTRFLKCQKPTGEENYQKLLRAEGAQIAFMPGSSTASGVWLDGLRRKRRC